MSRSLPGGTLTLLTVAFTTVAPTPLPTMALATATTLIPPPAMLLMTAAALWAVTSFSAAVTAAPVMATVTVASLVLLVGLTDTPAKSQSCLQSIQMLQLTLTETKHKRPVQYLSWSWW